MDKLLSIIIPTYNMEQLLPRCLDSLVAVVQALPMLDIIVVNDGSKDSSSAIAHGYAQRYPQSVRVIDKENGNYGSCVNRGLKEATGKYFRILDADDWFHTDGLELLVEKLQKTTADVVITHYTKEFARSGKSVPFRTSSKYLDQTIPIDSEKLNGVDIDSDFVMHTLTYRTELLRDINFRHTEGISYTDTEYVYYPMMNARSVVYYDFALYRYYVGREGQTVSISSRVKHMDDMHVIIMRMMGTQVPRGKSKFLDKARVRLLTTFFASYYWSVLVIQKFTVDNHKKLVDVDNALRQWDADVYESLNFVRCLGIPYISYWRKHGTQIIPHWLYRPLRKLFVF